MFEKDFYLKKIYAYITTRKDDKEADTTFRWSIRLYKA